MKCEYLSIVNRSVYLLFLFRPTFFLFNFLPHILHILSRFSQSLQEILKNAEEFVRLDAGRVFAEQPNRSIKLFREKKLLLLITT